jgi:hypothetical protein
MDNLFLKDDSVIHVIPMNQADKSPCNNTDKQKRPFTLYLFRSGVFRQRFDFCYL